MTLPSGLGKVLWSKTVPSGDVETVVIDPSGAFVAVTGTMNDTLIFDVLTGQWV